MTTAPLPPPNGVGGFRLLLRRITENRRTATAFVAVIGGLALVLGTITLSGHVRGPFVAQKKATNARLKADIARINALRSVDTDRDSLSDYEELYGVYHTSPYLADSDSDGISDAEEEQRGTDPNCPEGRSCGGVIVGNTNTPVNGGAGNTNLSAALSGNLSAAELRLLLTESGAPQSVLDSTSDADLLSLYRQTLSGATNVNQSSANSNTVASSDLQQLSPAAIRQLLIQNGVDSSMLDGVDDATLQSIFIQALNDVQNNTNSSP